MLRTLIPEEVSNLGHPIQYKFYFSDGTDSGWLLLGVDTASKVWTTPGNQTVTIQARCSIDTNVLSAVSAPWHTVVTNPSGTVTTLATGAQQSEVNCC